jgi:hypothetical protein
MAARESPCLCALGLQQPASDASGDLLLQVAWLVDEHKIPPSLVINGDQTGANIFPVSRRTWAKLGARQVRQLGLDDKRQLTAMVACSAAGDTLPLMVIFQVCMPGCWGGWLLLHDLDY